jgi:thiol-disulfide isomerase/thioredoxin
MHVRACAHETPHCSDAIFHQKATMIQRRDLLKFSPLALLTPAWAQGNEAALPKLGSTLQLPDVKLLGGEVWQPQNNPASTLVVYWWASWCPFCAVQSPHIEALWRTQKANGLQVLALSIDKQESAAMSYMKSKGYSFPAGMLVGDVAKMLPKPKGLPVVAVLKIDKTNPQKSREGKVVFAEGGEMFPEDIEGLKKYI